MELIYTSACTCIASNFIGRHAAAHPRRFRILTNVSHRSMKLLKLLTETYDGKTSTSKISSRSTALRALSRPLVPLLACFHCARGVLCIWSADVVGKAWSAPAVASVDEGPPPDGARRFAIPPTGVSVT